MWFGMKRSKLDIIQTKCHPLRCVRKSIIQWDINYFGIIIPTLQKDMTTLPARRPWHPTVSGPTNYHVWYSCYSLYVSCHYPDPWCRTFTILVILFCHFRKVPTDSLLSRVRIFMAKSPDMILAWKVTVEMQFPRFSRRSDLYCSSPKFSEF